MKLPRKPQVGDPVLQKWINNVHSYLETLPPRQVGPPGRPTNLEVTPGPGQNQIVFTQGQNAQSHLLLVSPTRVWNPSNRGNQIIDLGASNSFAHVTGVPGQEYSYWVVSVANGLKSSPPTGPIHSTTLPLATPLTPPTSSKAQPGNLVDSQLTQLPTITLTTLTRGGRQP